MTKCEWCNKDTQRFFTVDNLGSKYKICPSCANKLNSKVCRICDGPLGRHDIKGICLSCIQTNRLSEEKVEEEDREGVSLEQLQVFTATNTFTEEDYNNWLKFGLKNSKPIQRKSNELTPDIVIKRFEADNIWNTENIVKHMNDIRTLLKRNIDKIKNQDIHLIRVEDAINFMGGVLIDREGSVVLISMSK